MSQPGRPRKNPPPTPRGEIHPDCVYPLALFRQLVGLEQQGIAAAKMMGLRVAKVGRVGFVRGRDFCDLIDRLAEKESSQATERARKCHDESYKYN